jgi:hypothetical protein
MNSDFPEFDRAYKSMLLPENPDQFDLIAAEVNFSIYHNNLWHGTGQRFAHAVVQACVDNLFLNGYDDAANQLTKHFGAKE